ncbi:MAG: hypothetical protein ACTSPY_12085 [Candidatus Helarchaeota archaeon]
MVIKNLKNEVDDNPDNIISSYNKKIEAELSKKKKDFRLLCNCYWLIGDAYKKKEEYLDSIESYKSALKYAKKVKGDIYDKNCRIAKSNYKIGNVYIELQEPDNIIKYRNISIDYINKNRKKLIKELKFPLNKSEYIRYLNFTHIYFKIYENLIKNYYEIDAIYDLENKLVKLWNKVIKNKKCTQIFDLGYTSHILALISFITKDYDDFCQWLSLNIIISNICITITSKKSGFYSIWEDILYRNLNLGLNFIKNYLGLEKDHIPKMKNKLIDIILNSELSNQDYRYLDKLYEIKSENKILTEDIDNFYALVKKVSQEKNVHEMVKALYREELMLALLEKKKYSKSIEVGEENIKFIRKNIMDKSVKQYLIARTYHNLFRIECKKQNYSIAEKHGRQVINIYNNKKVRRKYDELLFLIEFGCFYIQEGERYSLIIDNAKNLLNKSLEISVDKRNKSYEIFMRIFRIIGEIEWRNNKYLKAISNHFKSKCIYLIYNPPNNEIFNNIIGIFFSYLEKKKFNLKNVDWKKKWL